MWEQQVNLEYGMLRAGAQRVQDTVVKARERNQMTRTTVVRGLLIDWLPGVAEAVTSWVKDVERSKGGPRPIAYALLKTCDPYTTAMIGMRSILDAISINKPKLVRIALRIGQDVEYEQRVVLWAAKEPALYYHYKDEMDKNRATDTHRRRVNINRFNALVKEGTTSLHWDAWTMEQQFRVGVAVLDCIMRKTGWFELQPDPEHIFKAGRMNSPQLVIGAREGLLEWIGKAFDHAEVTSPMFKPTVMPPKRWDGTRIGGYWTPYVRAPRLVRFKASQETQKERAADEYDALDMPEVYDAIHLLQETPWKVNKRVLEVALKAWPLSKLGGFAKLPEVEERELPARTPRMLAHREAYTTYRQNKALGALPPILDEETDREIFAWKKLASPIHRFNAKRLARMRATTSTIQIAQEYADYPAIYFPHMLDFRGRIYPVANFLQPQGNDIARGLLTFADGFAITEANGGAGWLAIQLATSWGMDKVSFEDRIQWVEENETMWRLIDEDPFENREWSEADKPFQTLAAIFEWVEFLNTGYGFYSHLPVMVDGTCNGIQHLSAIMRDPVAGAYVNLVPGPKPRDIYKLVAAGQVGDQYSRDPMDHKDIDALQQTLERIEKAGGTQGALATYWLNLCNRDLPRALTKRQVMVLPYGGKLDAYFKYTREWLDEHDPVGLGTDDEDREKRNKRVVFMAKTMMDACKGILGEALKVMDWLQECAKAVAVANQPIYWTTPAGFTVRHFYGVDRAVVHEVKLDGHFCKVTRAEKTSVLSAKDQTQGIAPNFIHSLDAAALKICLSLCREAGITEFASVHDAYGTHAANMGALSQLLREAFVQVHEHDVLGEFRAACARVLVDALVVSKGIDPLEAYEKAEAMLPPPLEKGTLDIHDVLNSPYFFA